MTDIEIDSKVDKYDIWYFLAGGLAALVALYLIKNILEPSYHQPPFLPPMIHHCGGREPVPIAKVVEKGVFRTSDEGKLY